jgi:uncharacterized LabA/DUF88 family protein
VRIAFCYSSVIPSRVVVKPNRAIALIDGYNFYHPIKALQGQHKVCLQWLDYPNLLNYYLLQMPKKSRLVLRQVYFFSALAKWRDQLNPGSTKRHRAYLNVLKHHRVEVILGNFKVKKQNFSFRCEQSNGVRPCKVERVGHEEKETDVRIACKLLELAVNNKFDTCLLLSADSDLVPAIETLKVLYPQKKVILVTPPSRAKIDKLQRLSAHHISVGLKELKRFQYPDVIQTGGGYALQNPWQMVKR